MGEPCLVTCPPFAQRQVVMERRHHQSDSAGPEYSKRLEMHSKTLSHLLRHSGDVALRPDGYARVSVVLEKLGTRPSREELLAVVATSHRQGVPRFEIASGDLGEWIRATGSPKELVLTVVSVNGEVILGPSVQMSTTLATDLLKQISKIVGQPTIALKLFRGTSIITSTLECLENEAEPKVQCIIDAGIARAKSTFDTFLDCFSAWSQSGMRLEEIRVPVHDFQHKLDQIRECAGLEDFPDDLAAWLPVLLSSPKIIEVNHFFEFHPKRFGRQAKLAWPPSLGPAPGGLIYFSMSSDDGDIAAYVVDAGGQLAEVFGQGLPGGVWCTIFFERTWSHFNRDRLSVDIWRAQSESRAPQIVHVAPNLQHFFEVATKSKEAMYQAIDPNELMD